MTFWDSSAIVPLIVSESNSEDVLAFLDRDPVMIVWWGTPVECAPALARRERTGDLSAEATSQAILRLNALSAAWHEVNPSEAIRIVAVRILRVHPLRSADALQLAAAIIAAEQEPQTLEFLTLDERLRVAAEKEGFSISGL